MKDSYKQLENDIKSANDVCSGGKYFQIFHYQQIKYYGEQPKPK